jgi:competence protein ComEC
MNSRICAPSSAGSGMGPRATAASGSTATRADARASSPFAPAGALAWLAGILAVQHLPTLPPAAIALAALILGVLGAWRWPAWRWPLLLVCGAAWACLRGAWALDLRLPQALEGSDFDVVGRVEGLPRATADGLRFDLIPERASTGGQPVALGGRLRLADYREVAPLHAGQRLSVRVRLKRPRGTQNPGGFDFERHALERRYAATGYVRSLDWAGPAPWHSIDAWRERASSIIATRLGDGADASVLRALAVGDQGALDDGDWRVLRATGTAHLVAISGFHIGLVAGFGALLARRLAPVVPGLLRRCPRQFLEAGGALMFAAGYTLLAGWSVPVQRTLLMIAVVLAAIVLRRATTPAASLALAAWACLLLDPLAVLGAGFWLSFAGVAWLVYCFAGRERVAPARELTRAQAAMTLGLLPLSAWFFQQSSVVGPLANLIAVPWVSLIVVPLALIALVLMPLSMAAAGMVLDLAAASLRGLWWLLERLAAPEWAQWFLPEPSAWTLALALLGLAWLLLPRAVPGRLLGAALLVPLLWPMQRTPPPGAFDLIALDVGQGQALLVRTHRHAVLVDAGAAFPSGFDFGSAAVVPALRALGVDALDVLVVSHGDNDHAGGAPGVIAALAPHRVLGGAGVRLGEPCRRGDAWTFDGVRFTVLHPPPHFPDVGNDGSCVVHVAGRAAAALLPGDISSAIEQRLLREPHGVPPPDLLVIPHHGSRSSSSEAFAAALRPRFALVSAGHRNRYGHPDPRVLGRWRAHGATVAGTAEGGALAIRLGGDALPTIERWREARRRYWHER